jgi:ribosomal protein S10
VLRIPQRLGDDVAKGMISQLSGPEKSMPDKVRRCIVVVGLEGQATFEKRVHARITHVCSNDVTTTYRCNGNC